jgi:superfamily II DNA helicase RecQ
VYTRTRLKKAEDYAAFLMDNDISANFYHAGLDAQTRAARQQAFQDGEVQGQASASTAHS